MDKERVEMFKKMKTSIKVEGEVLATGGPCQQRGGGEPLQQTITRASGQLGLHVREASSLREGNIGLYSLQDAIE